MTSLDETRLDQNVKRVGVGSLVTVMNVTAHKRQHYYISDSKIANTLKSQNAKISVLTAKDGLARVLIGKMKGDKVFHRDSLIIEFIEWPNLD